MQFLPEVVITACRPALHCRGDDAPTDPDDLGAAGARELPRSQHVQELGDQGARQGPNLLQVDRAVVRELEAPEPLPKRQGAGPHLVAE